MGRAELFDDPDQVVVTTNQRDPFQAYGASVGVDWTPAPHAALRTELRGLAGRHAVFTDASAANGLSTSNVVLVTSLSVFF